MNVEHINHVVLYAKDFYRHTGDVVSDMRKYCQMDGAKPENLVTPYDVLDVMNANYSDWVDSISNEEYDDSEISNLRRDDDENYKEIKDPIARRIHHMLVTYAIYVPMSSEYLKPPKYDEDHMPQFNTRERLFTEHDSFKTMEFTAEKYLDRTQPECMEESYREIVRNFKWERCAHALSIIEKKAIYEEDLVREFDGLYARMKSEHMNSSVIEDDVYEYRSPHLIAIFDTTRLGAYIELEGILAEGHFTSCSTSDDAATDELFDSLNNSSMNIKTVNAYDVIDHLSMLDERGMPCHLAKEKSIKETHNSRRNEIHKCIAKRRDKDAGFHYSTDCACFVYDLKRIDDVVLMDVYLKWFFENAGKSDTLTNIAVRHHYDPSY